MGASQFVHVPAQQRTKLQPKAIPAILIGYDENSKGYRCYDSDRNHVIISRDVRFDKVVLGISKPLLQPEECLPHDLLPSFPIELGAKQSGPPPPATQFVQDEPAPSSVEPEPVDNYRRMSQENNQLPSSPLAETRHNSPKSSNSSLPIVTLPQIGQRTSSKEQRPNVRLERFDLNVFAADFDTFST